MMKVEPQLDHRALRRSIFEFYGLDVTALTFVPEGEVSIAYQVTCAEGARYFLKLWGDSRQGHGIRRKLESYLPILHELSERGLWTNLPTPRPAHSGALTMQWGAYALALFTFIEGRPLIDPPASWPPGVVEQLAQAFAKLHSATPLLHSPLPTQSAFEMGFAADLRRGLAALDSIGPHHRLGQQRLQNLLQPRRDQLLRWLAQTEAMAPQAEQQATQLVLCHTDMGGHNVFLDSANQIWILDWEELILAPPEHDLQEHRGPHFAHLLAVYRAAGGVPSLDPFQFAFYLQRRYLADLTDWLIRILAENDSPTQDDHDLAGIVTYSLAHLDNFPAEMAFIRQTLAQVGAPKQPQEPSPEARP